MIPVAAADEPKEFDEKVRKPGLDAIRELVGERPLINRRGPRRTKVADHRAQIPSDEFPPFWRESLPDMLTVYARVCAYLSLYIEHGTGSPTVDHVLPKSRRWDRVYEWTNYRLACSLINSKKQDLDLVHDPFGIAAGLFAIEFVECQVVPGPAAVGSARDQVAETIETLGLWRKECCDARREYYECYVDRHIDLAYLERRAPFIAGELRRQEMLLPGDA
jgi:5-methylcytosine-specific restriction endonuclease McrA